MRRHAKAAVGEHGVGRDHLDGREGHDAAADGELGRARQRLRVEAETLQVLEDGLRADARHHAHRDGVAGEIERLAKAHWATEPAVVVARAVDGLQAFVLENQGRVPEHSGRRDAVLQGGGVDERLEAGAGLALRLQGVVELVGMEVPAADQRPHAAGHGVHGHDCALHVRQLGETPAVLLRFDAHEISRRHDVRRRARQRAHAVRVDERAPAQAVPGQFHLVAAKADHPRRAFLHRNHHRRRQAVDGALSVERPQGRSRPCVRAAGLGDFRDRLLRPAIAVAPVVGDQSTLQRLLGGALQARVERRMHDHPGVDVFAEAFEQLPANPLGGIGRRQIDAGAEHLRRDGRGNRLAVFVVADRALGKHPPQHQIAPVQRPSGAVDRIAPLGLLDDAGEHRHLRQVQLGDRLAVVRLRGGLHAVGALSESHDVHVELENLVLAKLPLHLQGQQHLLEFADELLPVAERDDLRQLHRQRACAGAHLGREQAEHVVRQGHEVDAAVGVEALVLGADEAVEKALRHVFEGDGHEPVAELRNQRAVRRVDAQRRLQSVMSVGVSGRNLRVQVEKN